MDAQQSSFGNRSVGRGIGQTGPLASAPAFQAIDSHLPRDFGWIFKRSQTTYAKPRPTSPRTPDSVPADAIPSVASSERVLYVGDPDNELLQSLIQSRADVAVLLASGSNPPVESVPEVQWYTGRLSAIARRWDHQFDRVILALAENEAEMADAWALLVPRGLLHVTFAPDSFPWKRTVNDLGGVVRRQFILADGRRTLAIQKGARRSTGFRSRGVAA